MGLGQWAVHNLGMSKHCMSILFFTFTVLLLHLYSADYNINGPLEQGGRVREMEQILRVLPHHLTHAITIRDQCV